MYQQAPILKPQGARAACKPGRVPADRRAGPGLAIMRRQLAGGWRLAAGAADIQAIDGAAARQVLRMDGTVCAVPASLTQCEFVAPRASLLLLVVFALQRHAEPSQSPGIELVETRRIELLTSALRTQRSPS